MRPQMLATPCSPSAFDLPSPTRVQYQAVDKNNPRTTNEQLVHTQNAGTLRARVRGRVQGVGFRMYVRDAARRLGLSGYVRNEYDGSVYTVATGARSDLEQLLGLLRRGPSMSWVQQVEVEWLPDNHEELNGPFEVRH